MKSFFKGFWRWLKSVEWVNAEGSIAMSMQLEGYTDAEIDVYLWGYRKQKAEEKARKEKEEYVKKLLSDIGSSDK